MKPILFNTEMVRAILDGRKMVTRRVVKPQHLRVLESPYRREHPEVPDKVLLTKLCEPPHNPGDVLYVRETWAKGYDGEYIYKADDKLVDLPSFQQSTKMIYRPSIHMPREAARIFLRVTDVRVERLQDMQPYDVAFEGFRKQRDFIALWDRTIKPADRARYGWDANPWAWVIEFERTEKQEGAHP